MNIRVMIVIEADQNVRNITYTYMNTLDMHKNLAKPYY